MEPVIRLNDRQRMTPELESARNDSSRVSQETPTRGKETSIAGQANAVWPDCLVCGNRKPLGADLILQPTSAVRDGFAGNTHLVEHGEIKIRHGNQLVVVDMVAGSHAESAARQKHGQVTV